MTPRAEAAFAVYLARVAAWLDEAELHDPLHATEPLDRRQVTYLVDTLGMPPVALLVDGDGAGWPLFQARVERVGRLFRFATEPGEGQPAVVMVARDRAGRGDEMVAWSARDGWVASESGALALLGAEWTCPLADDAVDVHADVLGWLRAGRRGVVMVERKRAAAVLRECGRLSVGDDAQGHALLKAMRVKLPEVLVREAA